MDPVDLVQAQVPDMLTFDLDREDLLVRPPFVIAEPPLFLRERHGRVAAEEPDDLRIREPFHAAPEVRRLERPEEDPLAAQNPTAFQQRRRRQRRWQTT